MTREESIKYLKEMKDECNDTIHKVRYVTQEEALEMAIKALEQEPSGDLISREDTLTAFADYVGSGMSMDDYDALWNIVTKMPSVKQEPSGDLISRQAVLKIIDGWYEQNRDTENIEDLIVLITYMDSVNQQKNIVNNGTMNITL